MAKRIVAPATGVESFDGDNPIAVALGVTLRRMRWTDDYYGTADALIAHGIITADQLPEKSCSTFYGDERITKGRHVERDEKYLHILRVGKKFRVEVGLPEVEQNRRRAAVEARNARERAELQSARDAAFYGDPAQLLFQARGFLMALHTLLADHTPGEHERGTPRFALRFSSEGIADILESLQEVREWVDAATIYPATSKAKPEAPKALQAAKADTGFQAFLQAQCLKAE